MKRAAASKAKRAAPDAVWATELPTDLWKRCLDFAYGPATACVDPLAPLKAAATLATVSRGTQRAMADPGLWKDLARGSERCGCDKIVLAADVGGFSAQHGRPWRVLGRALRDFLKKCTHCRAVEAPIRVPFGVRLCNACATIRPGGALIREGRARDDYHLAAADLRELPFLDTPRRHAHPARAGLHGGGGGHPVAGPRLLAAQRRGRARRGAARRGARLWGRAVPVAAAP